MAQWLVVVYFVLLFISVLGENTNECKSSETCVPINECQLDASQDFIYPCHSGLNLICCPRKKITATTNVDYRGKTDQFPINCGVIATSDKISGGEIADLGQFPWMALLGYKQPSIDDVQYFCGGSVITNKFVLSAAHCINQAKPWRLEVVRLGEQNLTSAIDCISLEHDEKVCSDPPLDFRVATTLIHQNFNANNLKHDIALIKLAEPIKKFTEFIKPICLPFGRNLDKRDLSNQNFLVSGWGKTRAKNVGGSSVLQYASVKVWHVSNCNRNVPPKVQPINHFQLCANGPKAQDACKGDSGGPLVNATLDKDREVRYFQLGVVSFAASLTCGNADLPTVYTRVDKYLDWIVDNVD